MLEEDAAGEVLRDLPAADDQLYRLTKCLLRVELKAQQRSMYALFLLPANVSIEGATRRYVRQTLLL